MELKLIPGFSLYLTLWQSVSTPETDHSKVSSIIICFQTCSGIPQWSTASASLYFPPLVLTQSVPVMCFPTRFLLYQINHTRSNHFIGLCLPVMLQAKCLGSFPLEPKALTFSHQQLALKWLGLCSICAAGVKEDGKYPIIEHAPASLMSCLIFVIQILSLPKKMLLF